MAKPKPRPERAPRQLYTMSAAEFDAMGGRPAPAGYDPEAGRQVELTGHFSGRYEKGKLVTYGPSGIISHRTINETDPGEGWKAVPVETIQALAEAHKVQWLTINWPDKYSPDFTAVPA